MVLVAAVGVDGRRVWWWHVRVRESAVVSGLVVAWALEANWGCATGLGLCGGKLCGGFWRRGKSVVWVRGEENVMVWVRGRRAQLKSNFFGKNSDFCFKVYFIFFSCV